MSCVAPGCKTGYGTRGFYPPGVGAHHIPKKPEIRAKWLEAIPRANWRPTKHSRICSLHFDEDDYLTERMDTNPHRKKGPLKVRRLRPDAVPHIFPAFFTGLPPMIYVKKEGGGDLLVEDEPEKNPDGTVKRKPGPAPIMKRRKEMKDGEFDVDSVMPWKLDFNTTEKEATFWLWEQKWRTFYNFIGLTCHDDSYKMNTLRSFLSDSALEVLESFQLPAYQANDVEYVLTALRIHAAKQMSVVNARMTFNLRVQEDHEVFDTFFVDLLVLAKSCEFCEGCRDSLIRDRIIIGLKDNETINKLIKQSELNLQQAITICRAEEKAKLFPDQDLDHDPYFDGDPFGEDPDQRNPDLIRMRKKTRAMQADQTRPDSAMSDIDDHTYSANTDQKIYYEEVAGESILHEHHNQDMSVNYDHHQQQHHHHHMQQQQQQQLHLQQQQQQEQHLHMQQQQHHLQQLQNQGNNSNVETRLVSVSGDQVIIEMEDAANIQNVLDLNDLNGRLVQMQGVQEPMVVIKPEVDDTPVANPTAIPSTPIPTSYPSTSTAPTTTISAPTKMSDTKEMVKKKMKNSPFKPKVKQTFEEYLAQLGLENFGVKEKFLCHMCPAEFMTSTRMLSHIKNTHEKEPETPKKKTGGKCKFCNEEFALMKHLKKHISEVHKDYKPFICKLCPAKFYQGGHLRRHIRILHENERRFACDQCPRRFGERDGLLKHKSNVHEEQKCDVCQQMFENGKELKIHMTNVHPSEKPHLCDGCGKSFANQAILNNHVLRVHEGETSERLHVCQACGNRFTHYHFLLYHIQKLRKRNCPIHEKLGDSNEFVDLPDYEIDALKQESKRIQWEQFPPKCRLCDITFTAVPTLRNHMATVHAKTKNFECGVCTKRFKTSKILAQHTQSVHLGMKPYDCPHCPAKFGQLAHRVRHVKVVHEGLKEYVCDSCGKKYANKIDLNNHLKKVHDQGFTFNCPHCGLKYEKKRDLLAHLEAVHEGDLSLAQHM